LLSAGEPDPLRYTAPLPFESVYYPLGFPLHLATNSPAVLEAAAQSWCGYTHAFDAPPLRLRVAVEPGEMKPDPPAYQGQEHLLVITADRSNAAVCDYTRRFGFCRLSEAAAADAAFVSYYFLEAMAYHMLTQWHVTPVHCACVASGSEGIALCGPSGAGKSTLAYACATRGWTYVSDNESWLLRQPGPPELIGNPSRIRFRDSAVALFPELLQLKPFLHANGKKSIDLRTGSVPGFGVRERTPVRYLIFLDRDAPAEGIEKLHAEEGLQMLLAGVPHYEPHIRREHEESLRQLVKLPVLRLRYRGMESGVRQLGKLIRAQ
jgi:hypothetical protein